MVQKPAFLISIDTEGDNLWINTKNISTHNANYLGRFQQLCEQYGFKPTYLTNYEMAVSPDYVAFAKEVIAGKQGEIGMHLHAWNSPPSFTLTNDDDRYKPYLIEYPAEVMREKVIAMTHLLEDAFSIKMVSHRAGRWAFNEQYAQLLHEFGYQVDCSVTPYVDWSGVKGNPNGEGGTNYSRFPDGAYFMDLNDISKPGTSGLLQVPMSTRLKYGSLQNSFKQFYDGLRGKKRPPSTRWLRPKGNNVEEMKHVAQQCLNEGKNYVEFMLHSSEFMPGGSPTFKDEASIEQLYRDLEELFEWLSERTQGMTMAEFYQSEVKIKG
ncbi:polysaccharide deacetylase family protein [Jinshanibacter sp. LJY008]|uniref:Polysaccharide deacetylase family protein n=1 Tax=Limnobaculum eriocheiris TaxID=2897391 RepID=A0A9X1MWT9_9GAMM|nr:polysaccharide deacetylase family protein [Limnobaculum eriocheiris]MCD1126404.1 polysaccharide deacetylase family protein [Limnobaculum eriocheiris]